MSSTPIINSLKSLNHYIVGTDVHKGIYHTISKELDSFYQIPYANTPEYLNEIFKISVKEKIDLIIPLTDPEVDVLDISRSKFENNSCKLAIPPKKTIDISRNKMNLFSFFKENKEIDVIETFTFQEIINSGISTEIISKPLNGRSSEGIIYFKDSKSIFRDKSFFKNYIFQKKIKGEIFTVDFLRDTHRNSVSVVRKELTRTANGAGITVEIVNNERLKKQVEIIGEKLEIIGCVNMEFIFNSESYYLIDINPRFSAGIGFSIMSGFNFVEEMIHTFIGKKINSTFDLTEGLYTRKTTTEKLPLNESEQN